MSSRHKPAAKHNDRQGANHQTPLQPELRKHDWQGSWPTAVVQQCTRCGAWLVPPWPTTAEKDGTIMTKHQRQRTRAETPLQGASHAAQRGIHGVRKRQLAIALSVTLVASPQRTRGGSPPQFHHAGKQGGPARDHSTQAPEVCGLHRFCPGVLVGLLIWIDQW